MTRTPTPRYAPGRRPRAYHQTHARSVGPTRESAGPRARRGAQAASALGAVSHAIRLNEFSTVSANVAIPTIWLRGATQCRGNCMRHSWDSSPGGSHALPPIAPPVAQPVTCQRPGTVKTVAANNLPKPYRDRSRDYAQTHNLTTTSNIDFPALTRRKVTTKPTHFAHPPRWHPPPPTPTFPHQQAEKSPLQQHDLSILIVGPNQLKHRLSRTRKPKSHPSSNTQCPITPLCPSSTLALTTSNTDFPALTSRKVATKPTRFVHPHS